MNTFNESMKLLSIISILNVVTCQVVAIAILYYTKRHSTYICDLWIPKPLN